jgi:hypothetical protein
MIAGPQHKTRSCAGRETAKLQFSFEEKAALSARILKLWDEDMHSVVKIIQEEIPDAFESGKDIEFQLLSDETLKRLSDLEKHVKPSKKRPSKKRPRKKQRQSTGGHAQTTKQLVNIQLAAVTEQLRWIDSEIERIDNRAQPWDLDTHMRSPSNTASEGSESE